MAEWVKEFDSLKKQGLQGGFVITGSPDGTPLNIDCNFYFYDKEDGYVSKVFKPFNNIMDDLKGTIEYRSDEKSFKTWDEPITAARTRP